MDKAEACRPAATAAAAEELPKVEGGCAKLLAAVDAADTGSAPAGSPPAMAVEDPMGRLLGFCALALVRPLTALAPLA